MIVPDVNLLIHAYNSSAPEHDAARRWWEGLLQGPQPVGLAWVAVLGFIRIMTHRGSMQNPMPVDGALGRVRQWLACPQVQFLIPGEDHAEILFGLLEALGIAGNLTTDAHLAALAIEYRAEIATTDADFSRFSGLRWFNPIAPRRRKR